MKVFISWSKPIALKVAEALRDWLPFVINQVKPWMSGADLEAGVRWGQQLANQLAGTDFGIVCLTQENLAEPWIHFEAGALSKQVANPTARLIPVMFRIEPTQLPKPLQQFQAVGTTRDGILSLVRSIHAVLDPPLIDDSTLRRAFDKWWPDLDAALTAITIPEATAPAPEFDSNEALRETLLTVRELARTVYKPSRVGVSATIGRVKPPEIIEEPYEFTHALILDGERDAIELTVRDIGIQKWEIVAKRAEGWLVNVVLPANFKTGDAGEIAKRNSMKLVNAIAFMRGVG